MAESQSPAPDMAAMRRHYDRGGLHESSVAADPFTQFQSWFDEAHGKVYEPNAVCLATATPDGAPSVRIVLIKGFDANGVVFYTNYESRKGSEMAANPRAALLFYWGETHRQVRIEGLIAKVSREESAAYFNSRPLGSRIGALASNQSQPIENRDILDQRVIDLTARYAEAAPTPPENWGGYRLTPRLFEFWQGRPNRVHDRLVYERDVAGGWRLARLQP